MADRRDFMGYIGTGAIGSIVGYYVGAQKLLGIQSEDVVVERPPDQSTEEPPEDTPTEEPPEDTPTEDLTVATFEQGSLTGWRGTDAIEVTDSRAYEGDRSLIVVDQNGNYADGIGDYAFRDFINQGVINPSRIAGAVFNGEATFYTARMFWGVGDEDANSKVNSAFTIGINNHEPLALNGTSLVDSSRNEWYFVELDGINWTDNIISEVIVNDSTVEEDMSFSYNPDGISRVGVHVHAGGTGTRGYFDNLTGGADE
jgi:hypothetical protein